MRQALCGLIGAEGGREYSTAEISAPTLADVYLPPFRAAVDGLRECDDDLLQRMDGLPASAHAPRLTGLLRTRWRRWAVDPLEVD